jgi:hypothetical protein
MNLNHSDQISRPGDNTTLLGSALSLRLNFA